MNNNNNNNNNPTATIPVGYVCISLADYNNMREDIRIKNSIISRLNNTRTDIVELMEREYKSTYRSIGTNSVASVYVSDLAKVLGMDFEVFQADMEFKVNKDSIDIDELDFSYYIDDIEPVYDFNENEED